MAKPLKVLIVEDREDDAQLVLRQLRKAGYEPAHERVQTYREMNKALDKQEWDIVISDYFMPSFGALEALKLLRDKGFAQIPFVIVSGSIGEETAVQAIKKGADNYIFKDNFKRFPKIIGQELEVAEEKKALNGAQKEILRVSKEWEKTFGAINDSVLLLDTEHTVLNCNTATVEMLNIEKKDIVGKHCYEIIHGLKEPVEDCPLNRTVKSKHREKKTLNIGEEYFEVLTDPILDEQDNLIQIVHVCSNITERKKDEIALKKAKQDLENWSKELEKRVEERTKELKETQDQLIQSEKMAAAGVISAGVAHELNNPLAGVTSLVRTYAREKDPETTEYEDFKEMEKACEHMVTIIKNFSTLARPLVAEYEKLNCNELIEGCLSFIAYELRKKHIEVKKNYDKNLPAVMGNKGQLQQVVVDMVTNARDAVSKQGKLEITTRVIDTDKGQFVEMQFSDNGCGISKKDRDKIFDPFFTTKRNLGGVGLGLSIVYGIVQDHKGTILVNSKVEKGTTFKVRIPVAE